MPTLKEQMEELTALKHRLAVWETVHEFLEDNFVSKDEGRPAQKAIRAEDCLIEMVPEETIEDVLQTIGDGPITELRARIAEVEGREVVLGEESKS